MLKVILLIAILIACAFAQSFPQCGPDSATTGICCRFTSTVDPANNNQTLMMTTLITNAVVAVVNDPIAAPWFNGTNDPQCFSCNLAASQTQILLLHLIQFFGAAMGCNATGSYQGVQNLGTIHTAGNGFVNVSVNKAAFEHFNFQVIRAIQTLLKSGTSNTAQQATLFADVQVLSSVLDAFRKSPGFGSNGVVCNAPDCVTPPYTLWATTLGGVFAFSPTYLSIPINFKLQFVLGTGSHTFNQVTGGIMPALVTDQFNTANCQSNPQNLLANGETFNLNNASLFSFQPGLNWFQCNFHCGTSTMVGILNILAAAPTPAPTPAPSPPTPPTPATPAPTPKSAGLSIVLSNFLFVALFITLLF